MLSQRLSDKLSAAPYHIRTAISHDLEFLCRCAGEHVNGSGDGSSALVVVPRSEVLDLENLKRQWIYGSIILTGPVDGGWDCDIIAEGVAERVGRD